jgi:hypothetical protein
MIASPAYSDHPTSIEDPNQKVEISFIFPNGSVYESNFSYFDIQNILLKNPLNKDIYVDNYKIDWWVYGALQHFKLPFEVNTKGRTGYWESVITKIGDYTNGSEGNWAYYVNNIKSNYHISTQTDQGLKRIKFIFTKAK